MSEEAIKLGGKKKSIFMDKVKAILPEGGNLNLCLTCGACASGCPATGLEAWTRANFCAWPPWGWTRRSRHALGLDVHHVSAVHLCLPHENRHPPAGLQCPGRLAPGNPAQGHPGFL